MQTQQDYQEI